eukprot:gene13975-15433_t
MEGRNANCSSTMVYVCQTCGKGFQSEKNLGDHNIAVHLSSSSKFIEISPLCGENSNLPEEKDGTGQYTEENGSTLPRSNNMADQTKEDKSEKAFDNFDCGFMSCDLDSIEPMRDLTKNDAVSPKKKTLMKGKRMFNCTVCSEEFKKKRDLTNHMLLHPESDNKKTVCEICDKKFSQSSALLKHQRIHSGEKPYKCNICNKGFNAMCNLITHERTHTGEKPFTCQTCGKKFSVQCNLTTHERTHSGEKPFACDLCDKSFSVYHNLITHKRTHSGEKPFACSICQKQFSVQCNLITHLRTHSDEKPYECKECGKSFRAQCNLRTHMHVHSTEKPHSCDACGKRFNRAIALARHREVHLITKKYECSVCAKGFNNKQSFAKHAAAHGKQQSIPASSSSIGNELSFVASIGVGAAKSASEQTITTAFSGGEVKDISLDLNMDNM